jgi:hypothetical protein
MSEKETERNQKSFERESSPRPGTAVASLDSARALKPRDRNLFWARSVPEAEPEHGLLEIGRLGRLMDPWLRQVHQLLGFTSRQSSDTNTNQRRAQMEGPVRGKKVGAPSTGLPAWRAPNPESP